MSGLHFGLILPNYGALLDPEELARVTATAEEVGLDSAFVTDHVLVPAEHAPLYGSITEALVTLGFLIGRTRRIGLGVSALVVPLRNPYVVLKQLASLDVLSGGRNRDRDRSGLDGGRVPHPRGRFRASRQSGERLDRACPGGVRPGTRAARSTAARSAWRTPGSSRPPPGVAGPSSGLQACLLPRSGAPLAPACGTLSRCRRRSLHA